MTQRTAGKSGNWSDPTVWSGGAVPVWGDDVDINTRVIALDVDITGANTPSTILSGVGGQLTVATGITRLIGDTDHRVAITQNCATGIYLFTMTGTVTLAVWGSIVNSGAQGGIVSIAANQNFTLQNPGGTVYTQTAATNARTAMATTGAGTGTITGNMSTAATGHIIAAVSSSGSTLNVNGNIAGVAGVTSLLTITNGTMNFTGTATSRGGVGILFSSGSGTLNWTGAATIAAGLEMQVNMLAGVGNLNLATASAALQITNYGQFAIRVVVGAAFAVTNGSYTASVLNMPGAGTAFITNGVYPTLKQATFGMGIYSGGAL